MKILCLSNNSNNSNNNSSNNNNNNNNNNNDNNNNNKSLIVCINYALLGFCLCHFRRYYCAIIDYYKKGVKWPNNESFQRDIRK